MNTLHEIGTAGLVVQVTGTNWPRPSYTLLVTGLCRFQLISIIQEHPYPVAAIKQIDYIKTPVSEGMYILLSSFTCESDNFVMMDQ